jgi:DNA repair protein RadD
MTTLIPRDYQLAVDGAIWRWFATNPDPNTHPIVGMPTGTGKAFSIAYFMYNALRAAPNQRFINATHVKELVEQNYLELLNIWPTAPAGVYSAGLKRKDTSQQIIFAGIASIIKNVAKFGKVDILIVDECHLISNRETSMYMRLITALKERNPYLRVLGFTATPWREGQGHLTQGDGIFTHMAIDLTDMVSFNRFIKEGYLVPPVSKPTKTILDVDGVKLVGGDFNEKELQLAVNKDKITYAALLETLDYAHDRRSWIVFASGLEHCEKIREMLTHLGVSCRVVHSKMSDGERDDNIRAWKNYEYTAIINMGILTTGVNHPGLDLIVMLRPTMSSKLWVQMLGRGTRPLFVKQGYDLTTIQGRLASIAASPKQNCLVMDFAGNIKRCGPINDPIIPKKKGASKGEAPIKICDHCDAYNHISARFCGGEPYKTPMGCGAEFIFQVKIQKQASTQEVIRNEAPEVKVYRVEQVLCSVNKKAGKPDSVRVTYYHSFSQKVMHFLLINHSPHLRDKAEKWWKKRTNLPMPNSAEEAVKMIPDFPVPTHVRVWANAHPFPQVMDECFMDEFEAPISPQDDDIPF